MNKPLHLSLIAVIGKNRELGRDNKLLFNLPKDMARFKEKTTGHVVIMGRKTFESIGHALPNRTNIVVTRDKEFKLPEGVIKADSIENALEIAKDFEDSEVFVIGGAQIYSASIKYADKLYLTVVDSQALDADAFFPEYKNDFKRIITSVNDRENGHNFVFIELER